MEYNLRSCVWEITLACCFSCAYCGSKAGRARVSELTTAECLDVADQLAGLGCRRVSLIGGEVFMRSDWHAIVKRLTDQNVRVSIITNGSLFSRNMIAQLRSANVGSVAISVDGAEQVHDKYRQKGSFQRARKAVFTLARSGMPVSVITTLHRENASQLEAFYTCIRTWPIQAWQLQACSPIGSAAEGIDYRIDPAQVIGFVQKHVYTAPFAMGVADNIGYFTEAEGYLRGSLSGRAVFKGCGAGLDSIGIDSVGNVRGCETMNDDSFIEGNLRSRSLREIWEDPQAFAYNRRFTPDQLTGPCQACRFGAYCAGGCRAYNFFVHKKLYEAPACARVTAKQ